VTRIYASYIEEPDLIFGHRGVEKDPKLGLKYFGPYLPSYDNLPTPTQIRIGVVGTGETISLTKQIVAMLSNPIKSEEPNKWLYPNFPGFSVNTTIRSKFVSSDIWNATILSSEIKHILSIADVNKRIASASNLFAEKIEKIATEESTPHVIICAFPTDLEEYCGISEKTRGAKRPKFTALERAIVDLKRSGQTFLTSYGVDVDVEEPSNSYDFRNSLKGKVMRFGIPTQILRESTMQEILNPNVARRTRQGAATFAWNFSLALYYKAHGRPWRLAKLPSGTCYVGISFYRNLLNPDLNVETSMAQVFTHSGEGFVLRGGNVAFDKLTRTVHLSKDQACSLLRDSIKKYSEKAGAPSRVVVHKTSLFSDEEKVGFEEAIGKCHFDLVAISQNSELRFLRTGKYPVLRGTFISLTPNQHLLYTTGYTPRVRTYPGPRIPKPLLITHYGDSEIDVVCSEILGLTKLNWNTTAFSTQLPITIDFAQRVGKILSELPQDKPIQDHYKFYM
jgi:hypothetical protein